MNTNYSYVAAILFIKMSSVIDAFYLYDRISNKATTTTLQLHNNPPYYGSCFYHSLEFHNKNNNTLPLKLTTNITKSPSLNITFETKLFLK